MSLISQSEYAKRRNISREAVRQAVAAGRVNLIDGKIDPAVADIQWATNTRNPKAQFAQKKLSTIDSPTPTTEQPDPVDLPSPSGYDLQLARAKREYHEANIAEMRERQKSGELVELHQVTLAYTALAAQLRAGLERIPDKLSSRLAAESDPHAIHILLTQELDQAIEDMAKEAALIPAKLIEQPT